MIRVSRVAAICLLLLVGTLVIGVSQGPYHSAYADSTTIQPSTKDSYVVQNNPTLNTGTLDSVWVSIDSDGDRFSTFVEFAMASIPTGSTIDSALLGLQIDNNLFNTNIRMQARRVVSTWTETGITWNQQPTVTTTDAANADSGTADTGWIEWNITGMVDDWVNNAVLNEGVRIAHVLGGSPEGAVEFFSRDYITDSLRPRLIVIYTLPVEPDPSYLVYLAGGIDNITSEVGATGTEFNVQVENTGNVQLSTIDLELRDAALDIKAEVDLFNIQIGETRNHQFIYTHGLSEGPYTWQLRANYTVEGITEYWNFTLYVGPSGSLRQIFVASSVLQPQQIDMDTVATAVISINNVGSIVISFRIQVTSVSLLISPTTAQTTIIQPGSGDTIQFLLYPQAIGLFFVDILVTPTNQTTGTAVGASFFDRHLIRVTAASSVTTMSAQDIGISDVILHGKINSLGGFQSATVYFTFWQTGASVDEAIVVPPHKQVVSFISDFRVWVGGLVPQIQYSYEFRMEVGPAADPTIYYGGIVNFTTTEVFADPFTAARNGFAEFLGIDSIIMGIMLASLFVILTIVIVALLIGDRLEGMAQSLAIGISGFAMAAIFFGIGYYPLWVLVFLGVLMAAIIIGLPTFQRGEGATG